MKKSIDINNPAHIWEKQNLVTLKDSKGFYDIMKCKNCGLKGKRRNFNQVEVDGRSSDDKIHNCNGKSDTFQVPEKIQIIHCTAFGRAFQNLTPGSIHKTVTPPVLYSHDYKGVWVMGNGEPVKVLSEEYTTPNQKDE